MQTNRTIKIINLIKWTGYSMLVLAAFNGVFVLLYHFEYLEIDLPWVPVSVIGTGVAFYLGFKNNSSYGRMWEARKIWGAIVNNSRSWGMCCDAFIDNLFREVDEDEETIYKIKKRLMYRHIAWLYTLRLQLLEVTPWEQTGQRGRTGKKAAYFQKNFGVGLVDEEVKQINLKKLLPEEEYNQVFNHKNPATHIIYNQSKELKKLIAASLIDNFRHLELTRILQSFYDQQGKCERIKKFPFPRQYANATRIFVAIFIFLLPLSIIPEILLIDISSYWRNFMALLIPTLISWTYVTMDSVGDYSENPFQGTVNDIPMLSLCRTIEIDLREMLGETDLPPSIASKNSILM